MYFMSMACIRHEVMDVKELTPCSVSCFSGEKTLIIVFLQTISKSFLFFYRGAKLPHEWNPNHTCWRISNNLNAPGKINFFAPRFWASCRLSYC